MYIPFAALLTKYIVCDYVNGKQDDYILLHFIDQFSLILSILDFHCKNFY